MKLVRCNVQKIIKGGVVELDSRINALMRDIRTDLNDGVYNWLNHYNDGKYDFKNEGKNDDDKSKQNYRNLFKEGEGEVYTYKGQRITDQDVGNMLFGYVVAQADLPQWVAEEAGHKDQEMKRLIYWLETGKMPDDLGTGDDPIDQKWIRSGYSIGK